MPPKAAAPSGDQALTAKEIALLRAMATLMDEAPKVSLLLVSTSISAYCCSILRHLLPFPFPLVEFSLFILPPSSTIESDCSGTFSIPTNRYYSISKQR
ncbi:hypothetical protein N431DRAFT_234345 [Stipitochalara longipes BDJ]|nr:hypothetical protein N431DRAFT_234345 [Stipitochalara longipes BDJ]